jgi:prevent-host-death family protein
MAATVYNIYEAKTALSKLVERAAAGEEIIIAKAGRPVARLMPVGRKRQRKPGGWEGQVRIAHDFDAPLPAELEQSFRGED